MKSIERPLEIHDNLLWDLLSKLLEFDPNQRIIASEALQHPYFTSPEAIADISPEQQKLASLAANEQERDSSITEYDKDPKEIGKQMPLFDELQKDGTLTYLIQLFFTDKFNNKIKQYIATVIGQIFKAVQIPPEFGETIIDYIKQAIQQQDLFASVQQIQTLEFLSESEKSLIHPFQRSVENFE
ncbi:MAG: hypothetical protein EZS28_043242 [Streblomastix strix]|uniref:Protein kinase domain-containing protein n=1 Tax=Streblomastix strix TaxID=222440 RepID=A0A5J4TUJ7_9EUKA|nr:MAG: hypothetical protein EZS28_043242 [Streblomastix strix]